MARIDGVPQAFGEHCLAHVCDHARQAEEVNNLTEMSSCLVRMRRPSAGWTLSPCLNDSVPAGRGANFSTHRTLASSKISGSRFVSTGPMSTGEASGSNHGMNLSRARLLGAVALGVAFSCLVREVLNAPQISLDAGENPDIQSKRLAAA